MYLIVDTRYAPNKYAEQNAVENINGEQVKTITTAVQQGIESNSDHIVASSGGSGGAAA